MPAVAGAGAGGGPGAVGVTVARALAAGETVPVCRNLTGHFKRLLADYLLGAIPPQYAPPLAPNASLQQRCEAGLRADFNLPYGDGRGWARLFRDACPVRGFYSRSAPRRRLPGALHGGRSTGRGDQWPLAVVRPAIGWTHRTPSAALPPDLSASRFVRASCEAGPALPGKGVGPDRRFARGALGRGAMRAARRAWCSWSAGAARSGLVVRQALIPAGVALR